MVKDAPFDTGISGAAFLTAFLFALVASSSLLCERLAETLRARLALVGTRTLSPDCRSSTTWCKQVFSTLGALLLFLFAGGV
jgi:hypothetical protein